MTGKDPICKQNRWSCKFYEGGCCLILNDTTFKQGRKCPFYKKDEEKKGRRRKF